MNIVLVEDEPDLSALIIDHLKNAGIHTEPAFDAEQALELIDSELHDIIIMDRGLPDMDGLDLLKILREEGQKMPVLVLTAKDGLGDRVEGLNSGADDYLTKPFEMEELIARIHALSRRPSETMVSVEIKLANLKFIPADNALYVNEKPVDLSLKERDALERLIKIPERVVSKDTLQTVLYGYAEEGSKNSVEVIIHRLRKKLEDANALVEIKTLRGIGYILKEQDTDK